MKIQLGVNFLILIFIKNSLLQPQNPCPEIFKYKFDGQQWSSEIELNANDIIFGGTNILQAQLSSPVIFRKGSYLGSLELLRTREETIALILNHKPVKYIVKFAVQQPLPLLRNIVLNDRIVCNSFGANFVYYPVTYINLKHTLYTQLAAKRLAAGLPISDANQHNWTKTTKIPKVTFHKPVDINTNSNNNDCGRIEPRFNIKPLIFGGETIARGSWPWLTAIYLNTDQHTMLFLCGGSLISKKLILTSAHCFDDRHSIDDYIILLGRHNTSNWSESGSVARSIDAIYSHPDYNYDGMNFDADIAVVKFRSPVQFGKFIKPVCLPAKPKDSKPIDLIDERGIVVGWGRTRRESLSLEPRKIEIVVVSDGVCLRSNEQFRLLTSNRTFCAGNRDSNGPCTGDSGSGFMLLRNERWTIVGIVSAALSDPNQSSCDLNEYVIYADVTKFLNWIYETMEKVE